MEGNVKIIGSFNHNIIYENYLFLFIYGTSIYLLNTTNKEVEVYEMHEICHFYKGKKKYGFYKNEEDYKGPTKANRDFIKSFRFSSYPENCYCTVNLRFFTHKYNYEKFLMPYSKWRLGVGYIMKNLFSDKVKSATIARKIDIDSFIKSILLCESRNIKTDELYLSFAGKYNTLYSCTSYHYNNYAYYITYNMIQCMGESKSDKNDLLDFFGIQSKEERRRTEDLLDKLKDKNFIYFHDMKEYIENKTDAMKIVIVKSNYPAPIVVREKINFEVYSSDQNKKHFDYIYAEVSCQSDTTIDMAKEQLPPIKKWVIDKLKNHKGFIKYHIPINYLSIYNITLTKDKRLIFCFEIKKEIRDLLA